MKFKVLDSRLNEEAYQLKAGSAGANSIDLRACIKEPLAIYAGQQVMIPTGIQVALPKDSIGMLLPRSGLGSKGLVLGNLVGNIDPDYRGEINACLWNRNSEGSIVINPMDKIVQFVVGFTYSPATWEQVEELDTTERGSNGFGSTGVE